MSVPIKDRGRYTKSCPGWAITKKWLQEKLLAYVIEEPEDNTNSTITNPIELVTEDTPPMTPEVELKPVSEPVEPSGASYTAEPQIHFDKDKQVWLINKKNNMDLLKRLYDNKVLKMAAWNALGAFLSVLAIYLGDLSPQYSIILVPVILSITKYLNTKK